ncbi:MAG: shikimate kinase [Clostridiales bacterium]|nr:shikimate kinase [Clostridiales bacterium]
MKRNIVLIGMSGAGKSTVGVLLAKALGAGFVDTDIVLQQKTGKTLSGIIETEGTDAFLRTEEAVICSLNESGSVIATGGSAVYSPEAMASLKGNGTAVYLKVPFDELKGRLKNIASRGIVMAPGSDLYDVFSEREPLYERYCDVCADCSGADVEQCVARVIDALGEYGFFDV